MKSSRVNTESSIGDALIIPPKLTLPFNQKITSQGVFLEPVAEELISSLDTARMFSVRPGENQRQQQDIFISTVVEDIALQATLKLPIIRLTLEKQAQPDQHLAIAGTASNAAVAGIGEFIFTMMRYLMNVVMTNIVSQSAYGIYIAAYTSATIVGSIAALGLDSTMVRFLSIYHAKNESNFAIGLVRFVVRMTLISGLVFAALFFFSTTLMAHMLYHQDAYVLPFKEIALLIPLVALQLVFGSGLQALKAIKWKVFVDRLISPTLTLVLTLVFYLLGLRLEALILATICGYLASVITGQVFLRKASKRFIYDAAPRFEMKKWLHFALPMSLNSLIQTMLNSTDIIFLTAFSSAAQVGLYAAADRMSTLILMPLFAFNVVFSPLIAEYYVRGKHEQLVSLSRVVTKWAFSLSLPVFLCFSVFHEAILSIYSKNYTAGGAVLIILSFSNLVYVVAGLTGSILLMTGHARLILADTALTITINVALAFLLVPRFNVTGAALAAALSLIVLVLTGLIEIYCILKIFAFCWDLLKPVAAGGVASVAGLVLVHIIHVGYGYRAIIGMLGMVIPFLCVYVLVLALLRFSPEDKVVFEVILAKVRRRKYV